ncbi:multidrug transporter [Bacillus sp. HMSC76G11]|uniref:MFS transporter n=1 Tax=Metabacillus idriensis TaxID=324768 RepID=A0A6I2MGN6_9BACI|nr:MFS transporter [Metabacillus idriensis]MRX56524.1 MFS transporter [Metabacillus idriensis]OHR73419.1 multidrug transporter [Bacillus sp. HMSC76G11]
MESPQSVQLESIVGKPLSLWRNRTFLSLFAAYTLSIFGGTFHTIALNIWVLKTYDSATLMSAILITHLLVSTCFASIAGTAADRMNRKKMMWIADMIRCVLVVGLAAAISVQTPFWVIILLTALTALSGLFKAPAFNASLIDVVGKENIQTATGAMSLADNIARTLGFAAGGVIVAAFGGVTAILIDAFMFLLSVILVVIVKDFPEHRASFAAKTTFKQDFITGFTYIWKEPFARAITILSPTLILFFTTTLMIIQVMAIKEWKASPIEFGLIEASIPLGYMAGAGLIMFLGKKLVHRGVLIISSMIGLGPLYMLLGGINSAAWSIPLILLVGFMFSFCTLLVNVILRLEVSSELQGRVFGMIGAFTSVLPPAGLAVASFFTDEFGGGRVLFICGLSLFVIGLVCWVLLKDIKNYK